MRKKFEDILGIVSSKNSVKAPKTDSKRYLSNLDFDEQIQFFLSRLKACITPDTGTKPFMASVANIISDIDNGAEKLNGIFLMDLLKALEKKALAAITIRDGGFCFIKPNPLDDGEKKLVKILEKKDLKALLGWVEDKEALMEQACASGELGESFKQ